MVVFKILYYLLLVLFGAVTSPIWITLIGVDLFATGMSKLAEAASGG